uniref:Uncharacterized protein n=1 Tax=Sander lucioperca TaxID=283035 RepID=A0A8C9YJR0_SANLU
MFDGFETRAYSHSEGKDSFWMRFIQFKAKQNTAKNFFFPHLPSGFGNRCIQPKGPREPPLEWT